MIVARTTPEESISSEMTEREYANVGWCKKLVGPRAIDRIDTARTDFGPLLLNINLSVFRPFTLIILKYQVW